MKSSDRKTETSGSANEQTAARKKPYSAPSFRFERVFETSALACGKTAGQGGHSGPCHTAVKKS